MIRLYKYFVLVLSCFLLFSTEAFCTHIVGGSLTYAYGGANTYTITLKLYRDCGSGTSTAPANAVINIATADGSAFTPATVTLLPVDTNTVVGVLPPCATAPATPPCTEEYIYRAVVVLPPSPGGLHLYFQLGNRNNSITNIVTPGSAGETFYAYIPCYPSAFWSEDFALANGTTADAGATAWSMAQGTTPTASAAVNNGVFEVTGANPTSVWLEDFTLTNGTTSDAGATAWTRTVSGGSAAVNTNQFEVTGANNATMTWTSQTITISSYTAGVSMSVDLSEASNLEAGDNILVTYSLDGGAPVTFPVNGSISNDFTSAVATASGLIGNTLQVFITVSYDNASAGEIYRFDNVSVTADPKASMTWTSQSINISAFASGVNLGVHLAETGTLDAGDNITVQYSLNGGAPVNFTTNGSLTDDFTNAFASVSGLIGNTIQIIIKVQYDANSPASEVYQWDMVSVYDNTFITNSSPVFGALPPLYLCSVNSFTVNSSATDADGDVLVYSMYTPYNNTPNPPTFTNNAFGVNPVTWQGGYSATSPFNSGGPAVTLNAGTGQMTGAANSLGQYVFGIKCSEFRGGVLLSEIVRDYQANSVTCPPFVPTTPTVGMSNSGGSVCVGQTLSLTATSPDAGVTYNWSGPNSFTSTLQNPTIPNVTTAASGTYSVIATVSGCNSNAGTFSLSVTPSPIAPTAGSNSPVCVGSTISLTASSTGTTYTWSGPNSFSSALQNPAIASAGTVNAGTYSVTATTSGCTSGAGTISVTVSPPPSAPAASSNSPICAGQTLSLTANTVGGATYAWSGPNSFTAATQNPVIAGATTAASGTYSVTVTVGGCTGASGTTSVTINPGPAAPTVSSNSAICSGQTLSLTCSTVAGATYSWSGPNSFSSTLQNPTITNATSAATGAYSVSADVAGCAVVSGSTAATVNQTPSAPTAGSNSPVCTGSTLSLTASAAGTTYSWTGPNGFTSATQNPTIAGVTTAKAGTYSVMAATSGCTGPAGTVSVTINIPSATTIAASSNSPICSGNTLSLTSGTIASGVYSWSGPNGFTSALQNPKIIGAAVAAAGSYTVSVSVPGCASGGSGSTAVTINATPAAPAAGNNSPVCPGSDISLTATATGTSFNWSGPNSFFSSSQNPVITGATTASAGNYSVTASANGCTGPAGTTAVTITTPPSAPAAGNNGPVCVSSTFTLTASTIAGVTYSWSGPNSFTSASQNPVISNATTSDGGTYSVSVTSIATGCISPISTTTAVVNPPPAAPVVSSSSPVCSGKTLSLTSSTVIGAIYSWSGPNSFTSASQNPTIAGITTAGTGTYSVSANVPGCSVVSGSTSVTINQTPAAPTTGSNSPVCIGNDISLTASSTGTTYNWNGPNSFSSASQNPVISAAATINSGTYSVTTTSAAGCTSSTGAAVVSVNPPPPAFPSAGSNSPVCAGQILSLTCATIPTATYVWNGPNSFSSASQNPTIAAVTSAAAGTYSVVATVAGCGSSGTGTVSVNVNQTPSAPAAGNSSPVCLGQTLSLTASTVSGSTYFWSGPNGFSSAAQNPVIVSISSAGAGTYSVTADAGGCIGPAGTTVVNVVLPPVPAPASNSPVCVGNTLSLTANTVAGGTYSWNGPNSFSSSLQNPIIAIVTTADAGSYSLAITSAAGCLSAAVATSVNITTPGTVSAGADQTVCANNASISLAGTVSGGTSTGNWTTSGTGGFSPNSAALNGTYLPSIADTTSGTVTLTLTSTNNGGCSAVSDALAVTITPAPKANAGSDQTVCANNSVVTLSGSFMHCTGAGWTTTGSGTFSPDTSTMSATYTPGAADTAAGSVAIILTTTGNGLCNPVKDTMRIIFKPAPNVSAGVSTVICKNNANLQLNGYSSTGSGQWSTTGTGTFSPNVNTSNATYQSSPADTLAGSVILTFTSTNNGSCTAVSNSITITYIDKPIVDAGTDQTICANTTLLMNGSSNTGSGQWVCAGTGTFSPTANQLNATFHPGNADTTAGKVKLILTSTNNGTCIAVKDSMNVFFTPAPKANAGANKTVCANNSLATLTGTFMHATGATWSTTGSGVFSPNTTSMSVTYTPSAADTVAGNVSIILTTTGNGLCNPATDTMKLTIKNSPAVNAGPDQLVCFSNPVASLQGTSTTGSGQWTTLGTGTFANASALNTSYTASTADTTGGSVKLVLTSRNNGTCNSVSDTLVIKFTKTPVVSAGNDQTVCANNAVITLSGTSSTGSGFWTSEGTGLFTPDSSSLNGNYTPAAADTAAGSVTILITATNGCVPVKDSLVLTITPAPAVNAGADQLVCSQTDTIYLNGSVSGGATTGTWTTSGTGTFIPNNTVMNPAYVISSADSTAGTVTTHLTSTNNGSCLAVSDSMKIFILQPPSVSVGSDATVCANNATALNGVITGGFGTGIWTTTNGTGTFTPNNTTVSASYIPSNADSIVGNVILALTTTNNGTCPGASDTIILTVRPGPIVAAGADQKICEGITSVNINGTIGNATGGVWTSSGTGTFTPNDSALSAVYNVSAVDVIAGGVNIVLTSRGNGQCFPVTDTMKLVIGRTPMAGFSHTNGCSGQLITFTDTSSVIGVNDSIVSWNWTIAGASGTAQNPTHTYPASGTDTVTLVVTSAIGCIDTAAHVVTVNPTPVAAFTYTVDCIADSIYFTSTSTIPGGNIASLNWDFGDGNSSTLQNPVHSYSAAGTYTVLLTVTSDSGCTAIIADTVRTCTSVQAGFTSVSSTCLGQSILFTDTSMIAASDSISIWKWNFGDGGSSTIQNPSHNYATSGTYTVSLAVTTKGGASDTAIHIVLINPAPKAAFTMLTTCKVDSVQFTNTSTITGGNIVSWNWNFGDGSSSVLQNPVHSYSAAGTYTISLAVTSDSGCTAAMTDTLVFIQGLTAGFSDNIICPFKILFRDTTVISTGDSITDWNWTFGDGYSDTVQNPAHSYAASGTYTVQLITTSIGGCMDTASNAIILAPAPSADFLPAGGAFYQGVPINFTDLSANAFTWIWNFGDTHTDTIQNPSHTYSENGNMNVQLIVMNISGCPDTSSYALTIYPNKVGVPTAFTPNSDGVNDKLTVLGGPMKEMDWKIFNEWGNEVFRSTDQSIGWDGTYQGKPQPAARFVFILKGTTVSGDKIDMQGEVTIVR